jgi:hypothetical protein
MDFTISQNDQATAGVIDREIVPAGKHLMEIKAAEEKTNDYKKCDENPDGNVLALRLATNGGNHRFVFDDIPQHLGWRAQQLAAACGFDVAGGVVSLNPGDLIGRVVNVEISHYTSKAGKVSAVVKKYLPATAAAANKPKTATAVKRSPAAKVTAASDDSIPF